MPSPKPPKRSAAQLNREIKAALAAGTSVKITVHEEDDDADEKTDDDDGDEKTDEEHYMISDDGGEFDDASGVRVPDVQSDIDDRRATYQAMGRNVVLDLPAGRGWR